MKALTKDFTDEILQQHKGKGNIMLKTKLLSIQMSSSDPKSKAQAEAEAIKNKLSIVDFSSCENFLKENGFIPKDESLTYSKTDWNPNLVYPPNDNAGMLKSSSVSYDLFAANGTKIDRKLCKDTTTDIKIPLKNIDALNLKLIDRIAGQGFDIFDPKSPYFESRCIPVVNNDIAETILGRRKEFQNLTLTCNGGCQMKGINSTTGYLNCNCNATNSASEVGVKFAKRLIDVFTRTNIEIVKCVNAVFTFVNNFLNILA